MGEHAFQGRLMKRYVITAVSLLGLWLSGPSAHAFENYVATGHPYAPGDDQLPLLNSPQDQINLQTDIYESELYQRQRERKLLDSQMFQLRNDLRLDPPTTALEY